MPRNPRYNTPPPSAQQILDAIRQLPPGEKNKLARLLELPPYPLGEEWAVLPAEILELLLKRISAMREFATDVGRELLPYTNLVDRYQRGPRAASVVLQRRHRAIDEALAAGITDPSAIYGHLQQTYPELLKKARGSGVIGPKMMMKIYWRDRKSGN